MCGWGIKPAPCRMRGQRFTAAPPRSAHAPLGFTSYTSLRADTPPRVGRTDPQPIPGWRRAQPHPLVPRASSHETHSRVGTNLHIIPKAGKPLSKTLPLSSIRQQSEDHAYVLDFASLWTSRPSYVDHSPSGRAVCSTCFILHVVMAPTSRHAFAAIVVNFQDSGFELGRGFLLQRFGSRFSCPDDGSYNDCPTSGEGIHYERWSQRGAYPDPKLPVVPEKLKSVWNRRGGKSNSTAKTHVITDFRLTANRMIHAEWKETGNDWSTTNTVQGGVEAKLLASHLGEHGSIPNGGTPGISHVRIVLDDAAGRLFFPGISYFPRLYISGLFHTSLHPHWHLRPLRLKEVCMEHSRNERAKEAGDPRGNMPTNGIARQDSHMRKSGVIRPGIEPGSPWWEASRLTAQPPWPRLQDVLYRFAPCVVISQSAPPPDQKSSHVLHLSMVTDLSGVHHTYYCPTFSMVICYSVVLHPPVPPRGERRLKCSPPAKADRTDSRRGGSRMSLVGETSRGSPASPCPCIPAPRHIKLASPSSVLRTPMPPKPPHYTLFAPVSLHASHQDDPGSIPGRVTLYFRMSESCWTMPLIGGFSRGSLVSPTLSLQRCAILTSIIFIGSQDHYVKSLPNLFTHP
ncbi:hypothetical protein PR048_014247 [Dryococelus australis]|uniref:Uncharacterized protein n=1 Tax=Dryococelus australis TaxID=614101 RepID=A0ABQ9HDV0_9NEOP|nr:hypothetical protein PR048_014247 [Dryococelus australis]